VSGVRAAPPVEETSRDPSFPESLLGQPGSQAARGA